MGFCKATVQLIVPPFNCNEKINNIIYIAVFYKTVIKPYFRNAILSQCSSTIF